jgi:hypothetical protein
LLEVVTAAVGVMIRDLEAGTITPDARPAELPKADPG